MDSKILNLIIVMTYFFLNPEQKSTNESFGQLSAAAGQILFSPDIWRNGHWA